MGNWHKVPRIGSWVETQSGSTDVALCGKGGFRATQGERKEGGGVAGLTQQAKI